eukprot:m.70729 g.70729  ORF g.70729 m.70729 type:complete len:326 (-) comp12267_c0_seq1:1771-2748(-)
MPLVHSHTYTVLERMNATVTIKRAIAWLGQPSLLPQVFAPKQQPEQGLPQMNDETAISIPETLSCQAQCGDACCDLSRIMLLSVLFFSVGLVLSHFLCRFSNAYQKLTVSKQIYLSSCVVGALHAIISGAGAFYQQFYTDAYTDSIFVFSPFQNIVSTISAGYFAYDLALVLVMSAFDAKEFKSAALYFHHTLALSACIASLHEPSSYLMGVWLLTELSTPFVNLRPILSDLGYRHSKLYLANALAILVMFFLCRIVNLTWYWVVVGPKVPEMLHIFSPRGATVALVTTIGATALNFWWFSKIVAGAHKVWTTTNTTGTVKAKTQ